MNLENIESLVGKVPDYPKKGILFYDISPLLHNSEGFSSTVRLLAEKVKNYDFECIAAIDARGFIFGSALGNILNLGITLIRKKNKLPGKTIEQEYELEYGTDCLEIKPELSKCKFLLVDDLLATGGTAAAACKLIEKAGGSVECFLTLIELKFLSGKKLIKVPHETLIKY